MPSVGIHFDAGLLPQFLQEAIERTGNIRPLLNRIGIFEQSVTKKRFADAGPGWPTKNPYIAELQSRSGGSGDKALTFRGRLRQSIVYEVTNDSVTIGSPHVAAATHQFGSGGVRSFYLYIIPDRDSEGHIERDFHGRVLGKLALKQDPNAVKQLVHWRIKARPFLKAPEGREEEEILMLVEDHLARSGRGGH